MRNIEVPSDKSRAKVGGLRAGSFAFLSLIDPSVCASSDYEHYDRFGVVFIRTDFGACGALAAGPLSGSPQIASFYRWWGF